MNKAAIPTPITSETFVIFETITIKQQSLRHELRRYQINTIPLNFSSQYQFNS